MTPLRRRRQPEPSQSDFGSPALAVVIEDVAVGTRASIKRARRHDPLDEIRGVDQNMRDAAERFRDAVEGMDAGRGREPASDEPRVAFDGTRLLAQERALTSTVDFRLGQQAMGMIATSPQGVVTLIVLSRMSCNEVDALWRRREGTAKPLLIEALTSLAHAYGYA